jgi:hypothetical protein
MGEFRLVLGEDTAKVESSVGACFKYPTKPSTPTYIWRPRPSGFLYRGTLSSAARRGIVSEFSQKSFAREFPDATPQLGLLG